MSDLRFTLVSDGSGDQALLPLLRWLLRESGATCAIQPTWADLRRLQRKPRGLAAKIRAALDYYPCDVLFVHRDAEKQPREDRVEEIRAAMQELGHLVDYPPAICVVPVRMTEAWLLVSEVAIRTAAGNPNGSAVLELPRLAELENLPDPKGRLHELLQVASELNGRRKRSLNVGQAVHRIAVLMDDFEALRALPAFRALEREVQTALRDTQWTR